MPASPPSSMSAPEPSIVRSSRSINALSSAVRPIVAVDATGDRIIGAPECGSRYARATIASRVASRFMRWPALILCLSVASTARAQTPAPQRTILAIGAHAGDMELTTGALLIKQHKAGDRVVILQMTLGEGGNPKMTPAAYGAQK